MAIFTLSPNLIAKKFGISGVFVSYILIRKIKTPIKMNELPYPKKALCLAIQNKETNDSYKYIEKVWSSADYLS